MAMLMTLARFGTILGFFISSPAALSATEVKDTLGAAIPGDVQVYSRWKNSPAQEIFQKPAAAAFSKFANSGVLWDVVDLATMESSSEVRESVRGTVQKVLDALGKVSWEELLHREVAFGVRLKLPIPDYIVLFRIPESDGDRQRDSFLALFKDLAALAGPPLLAAESAEAEIKIASLGLQNAPFGIDVAARGDVLALSLSRDLLASSFSLMAGKSATGAAGSILDTPKFKDGVAGLRQNSDSEVYVDIAGYIGFYKGLLGMAGMQAGNDPQAQAIVGLINLFLDELARLGTFTQVGWTEGDRIIGQGQVTLQKGFETSLFFPVLGQQPALKDAEALVPAGTSGFYFSNGLDWPALYDLAAGLIRDRVPGGAELLMKWEKIQESISFHPRQDLFAWLEGSWGWASFPSQPCGAEHVFSCALKDAEAAKRIIHSGIDRLRKFLEGRGQALRLETGGQPGSPWMVLRVDAFPSCRPAMGIVNGQLVIGSSLDAATRAAAAWSGQAPSVKSDAAYASLIEKPEKGGLSEIYYADIQNQLAGFAQLLTGAGFFLSILPEEKELRPMLKLGAILTKVGTLFRELDTGLKTAGWAQFDRDQGQIRMRSTTTYRKSSGDL